MYSEKTQLVPKPQKCAKRRQKAQKGDFMAGKGAFGEYGKNKVFCNYFLIFFFIFIKSMKKVCFCSLNFLCFNLFIEYVTIYSKKFLILK